jgi:hypothetical protein
MISAIQRINHLTNLSSYSLEFLIINNYNNKIFIYIIIMQSCSQSRKVHSLAILVRLYSDLVVIRVVWVDANTVLGHDPVWLMMLFVEDGVVYPVLHPICSRRPVSCPSSQRGRDVGFVGHAVSTSLTSHDVTALYNQSWNFSSVRPNKK